MAPQESSLLPSLNEEPAHSLWPTTVWQESLASSILKLLDNDRKLREFDELGPSIKDNKKACEHEENDALQKPRSTAWC